MQTRRLEAFAFTALLLAGAALFISLQGNARAAAGNQPVDPAAVAAAPVQETFNYQGILREIDGALMNGNKDLIVKLYDAPINGTALHTETHTSVAVRDGLFNIVLGDQSGNPLSGKLSISPRYIAITVDGSELLPRQRVHPVPMALLAENANNATNAITATTLVPNASVSELTVNGTTTVNGTVNIGAYLRFGGQSAILVKQYYGVADGAYYTGISASQYHCSITGWDTTIDIFENSVGTWSRWAYVFNDVWYFSVANNDHWTPVAANNIELVCFHRALVTVLP